MRGLLAFEAADRALYSSYRYGCAGSLPIRTNASERSIPTFFFPRWHQENRRSQLFLFFYFPAPPILTRAHIQTVQPCRHSTCLEIH